MTLETEQERFDRRMMRLALRIARRGRPSPNPHVGAVVVREGQVLSVGHHERAGLAHAEVAALEAAGEGARGGTLYVTLEPCNHFGRTPPCTEAIEKSGIARVVVGAMDPLPHVPGSSDRLRAAGISVCQGVERVASEALVADFVKHRGTGLPFVHLKAALTLDGKLAARSGESKWITGPLAREHAHRLRTMSDAVLVGIGTVLADDPRLTVRNILRSRMPSEECRVVLDPDLRLPVSARIVRERSDARLLVMHADNITEPVLGERQEALQSACACPLAFQSVSRAPDGNGLEIGAVLRALGERNIVRLLVEGGSRVHGAFLKGGFADRLSLFFAPKLLPDKEALPFASVGTALSLPEATRLGSLRHRRLGPDILIESDIMPRYE